MHESLLYSNEQITKLICRKALTKYILNALAVTALVDNMAQVSIIDRSWKDLPDLDIQPLSELKEHLEDGKNLEVYAANGELMHFEG